ncbi:MAG TPA: TraB/GumN family protein [Caulobacteraceae bacterium]|jgi:hypothetical protein
MRLSAAKVLAPLAAASALLFAGAVQAEPAIWVVKGPHATIYLFGTVHLQKPGGDWMTPKIRKAFDDSDNLTLEIANIDDQAAVMPVVMKLGFDPGHPLNTMLAPADETKLEAAETALGLPAAQVNMMRPWMASLTVTMAPMLKQGYDPEAGVDRELKKLADARKEPVNGFETAEQQLGYFADMPQAEQISMLREAVDEYPTAMDKIDAMEQAWSRGEVEKLADLINSDMKKDDPALYELILVKRNEHFADQIADKLKGSGVSFVAVGAGHLAGPDSVQAQLAKKGIRAERF